MKTISMILLTMFSFTVATHAQAVINPFSVTPSTFIDDLISLRSANPRMAMTDLVDAANKMLEKQGVNFSLTLDAATCAKIRDIKKKQKDPNAPVRLSGALQSVDGDKTRLALPEAILTSEECGVCYLKLPLLRITKTDFITVILGRNVGFHLPANFVAVKVRQIDDKDKTTPKRTWLIPERLAPIGVSHDENVLYLAFKEPELNDLSLTVFTEGVFQIASRAEAEDGGKGVIVPASQPSLTQRVKFVRWEKTYLIDYQLPCPM